MEQVGGAAAGATHPDLPPGHPFVPSGAGGGSGGGCPFAAAQQQQHSAAAAAAAAAAADPFGGSNSSGQGGGGGGSAASMLLGVLSRALGGSGGSGGVWWWEDASRALEEWDPLTLVLTTLLLSWLVPRVVSAVAWTAGSVQERGMSSTLQLVAIGLFKRLPGMAERIRAEQEKMVAQVQASLGGGGRDGWRRALPDKGMAHADVLAAMDGIKALDKKWGGRCSGTVYMGGPSYDEHVKFVSEAYTRFSHTNPLHPNLFPSVLRMEAEVVAMTAHLLGGSVFGDGGSASSSSGSGEVRRLLVCGNVTSGGSESILMAVKSARDYMRTTKGITKPELVIAVSAHAAYDKAAHYFGITLRRAAVGPDFRADVRSVESLINRNTIMIVASAPGFPHGVIDPIEAMAAVARRRGVCLHVDCCLGGFVLPFARKLGYPIPPFGFEVEGVTSVSVDTHKYGLAPKGTSVVLFANHELRRHQYMAVTEWSGGLYVSPSVAGSRSGGLIAAAWAALMATGESGYMEMTKRIMETAQAVKEGLKQTEGICVVGEAEAMVVAFTTCPHADDVYKVNDAMSARGWSLSALQRPPSVHLCVTLQHADAEVVSKFLADVRDSVREVRENPDAFSSGLAPVYGAAAKVPDRGAVRDFLVTLMESSY